MCIVTQKASRPHCLVSWRLFELRYWEGSNLPCRFWCKQTTWLRCPPRILMDDGHTYGPMAYIVMDYPTSFKFTISRREGTFRWKGDFFCNPWSVDCFLVSNDSFCKFTALQLTGTWPSESSEPEKSQSSLQPRLVTRCRGETWTLSYILKTGKIMRKI